MVAFAQQYDRLIKPKTKLINEKERDGWADTPYVISRILCTDMDFLSTEHQKFHANMIRLGLKPAENLRQLLQIRRDFNSHEVEEAMNEFYKTFPPEVLTPAKPRNSTGNTDATQEAKINEENRVGRWKAKFSNLNIMRRDK